MAICMIAVIGASCGRDAVAPEPTVPVVPPVIPPVVPPVPPVVASIVLEVNAKLAVGGAYNVTARAYDVNGTLLDEAVTFTSSDITVLQLTSTGPRLALASALKRGKVLITAQSGAVSRTATVEVRAARIVIDPPRITDLSIGESVQLTAHLVDAKGMTLPDTDTIGWLTYAPSNASVSSTGLVTNVRSSYQSYVWVYASADGLTDSIKVNLYPFATGQSAQLRLVHAATGLDPVTFTLSTGLQITLAFGESYETTSTSGGLRVDVKGIPVQRGSYQPPSSVTAVVAPYENRTVFVAGDRSWAYVITDAQTHGSIRPDSSLIRVILAGGIPSYAGVNIWLTPENLAPIGLEFCQDVYGSIPSRTVPAVHADLVVYDPSNYCFTGDYGKELARYPVQPLPGRAMTYVLTGDWRDVSSFRLLTFTDN